ncbi:MAG: HEAT repeat domain-containing protein [Gammaproteobacteria bacterium]|nr:HEAT repeat domain-containing protein [Gammaproteobacteria bacterium]
MNLFCTARSHFFALGALVIGTCLASPLQAQISAMTSDGWHTWRVPAVDSAPEICCFSWSSGTVTRRGCDLDGRHGGFSTRSNGDFASDEIQMYALLDDGDIRELRALSSSCPVTASTAVTDLGPVTVAESIRWIEHLIESGNEHASEAIAAIAVHDGEQASDLLRKSARSNDADIREDSVFWMAQVRVTEMAADIKEFIFNDGDPDMREHAAFAYSQSGANDAAEVLIRQGRNDDNADVRSQAWFWLAQTEADESESEIGRAIREDIDKDVREEAVFALSQLPGERAVKALGDVLEDRNLDLEVREQALFWLAQDESDEAFEYIDRILSDN